jgi:hypothetical protein
LTITLFVSYKIAQDEVNFPIGLVGDVTWAGTILETSTDNSKNRDQFQKSGNPEF